MKLKFLTATMVLAAACAAPAFAGTKDYIAICKNPHLSVEERASCKSEMMAATTDSARTQVFRIYDLKTVGFAMDGTRSKPVQEANAAAK